MLDKTRADEQKTELSEYKSIELEQQMILEVLQLINEIESVEDLLRSFSTWMKKWSDCEAVGIRLREGDDFPYFETSGFPSRFVKLENSLCSHNEDGTVKKDEKGQPLIDCMCGVILSGRTDPSKNFFTSDGCFWSNSTSTLLAVTTDEDRQARTRNRCNGFGYESVALIPLRSAGQTFGLLQFNDPRKDLFTPEKIASFRRAADHVASFIRRAQAEEALRASEDRFRFLSGITFEGIHIHRNGVVLDANQTLAEMLGYKSVDEVIGQQIMNKHLTPESLKTAQQHIASNYQGTYEVTGIKCDGTRFPVEIISKNIEFHGEPARVVAARDITKSKRMEETLLYHKFILAETGRIAKVGGWEFNTETGEGFWTDEVARIHDLELDSPTSRDLGLSYYKGESRKRIEAAVRKAMEQARPYDLELELISAREVHKWVRTIGYPVLEGGKVIKIRGSFQDITEHKIAEQTLQDSKEKTNRLNQQLRALQEALARLAQARTQEEVMSVAKSAALVLTKADGVTFVLRDGDQCYYADEIAVAPLWKGRRFPMETCISGWVMLNQKAVLIRDIYADDRIPADAYRPTFVNSLAMVPIRTTDPLGTIGCYWAEIYELPKEGMDLLASLADAVAVAMENVQAYRLLQQRVKKRTAELERTNEELEAFAYSISHDLRSPLRGVDGYSKLLLEKHARELDEDGRFMLTQVRESTLQMGQMIDDLLAFSQMGRREMRYSRCDLKGITRELFRELKRGHPGRNLQFELNDMPDCTADPAMMKEVLRNLLDNAVKYTGLRDKAFIEVGNQPAVDGEAEENLEPFTTYFVRDNGVGFDPRYKNKLFKVFQRLHRAEDFNGTGIGLALVKQIINRHNGKVWAESQPEEGATFYFTLPLFEGR